LLAAQWPREREELPSDLPGLEPDPVEQALPDEPTWPEESLPPSALPEHAFAAVEQCEQRNLTHRVVPVYGQLLPRLRELSRIADLVVVSCPDSPMALSRREAVALATTALCPCLFAAREPLLPRRMVIAYDGSPEGVRTLRSAADLAAALNLRTSATVIAAQRRDLDRLASEVRAVLISRGLEAEVNELVRVRLQEIPGLAAEEGAHLVAGPPVKQFITAALQTTSLLLLTGF